MRKQVSVSFMVCGLLFTTCLIVANIVEQKAHRRRPDRSHGVLSYIVNDLIAGYGATARRGLSSGTVS